MVYPQGELLPCQGNEANQTFQKQVHFRGHRARPTGTLTYKQRCGRLTLQKNPEILFNQKLKPSDSVCKLKASC